MLFVAAVMAPLFAQVPALSAERRAVALQWDGVGGPVPGVLDLAPDGSGTLRFQLVKPERLCIGTISMAEGQAGGSWALACGGGMAASGRYTREGREALGEGRGTDTGGRAVSFAVGQALSPPPGDAAKAAPPATEPQKSGAKQPEGRKEEPAKRPATAAPSREQAATTTDALNEAELRKARERNWESSVRSAAAATRHAPAVGTNANQLTSIELDALTAQFKPCWNPNVGGRNVVDLVVEVEVYANPDGTIAQARPRQNVRLASDPFYQSAVDAAMRAVLRPKCGGIGGRPLPLPREKYEQWKAFVLVFDPKAMLGASAPGTPAAIADGASKAGDPCSLAGLGLDFGLSVIALNLSCRLLSGLGAQAALAQQYLDDPVKRAEILKDCVERYRQQPDAAGQSDSQLRQRCAAIGAGFPLLVHLGGFPTAAEQAEAVDGCVAAGGALTDDGRDALRARCVEEVSARSAAARDPRTNAIEIRSTAPPADAAKPAGRAPGRPKAAP